MSRSNLSSAESLKQAETDIAVLQVQYTNLDEKMDGVKQDVKDLRDHIDGQTSQTHSMIKSFQEENKKIMGDMSSKISAIEKWRWMLMGAGVLAGAMGWGAVGKLLGM